MNSFMSTSHQDVSLFPFSFFLFFFKFDPFLVAIERKEGRKKERKATSQFDSPPRFDGGWSLPPWDKMIVCRLHLVLISIQTGNLKDKNPTQQKEPSKGNTSVSEK